MYFIFRISYIWYSAIGFLITFILGVLGSLATGPTNPKNVDGDLLSPPVRSLLLSLPNQLKDWLNIPLKDNSGTNAKETVEKEAFTINLELFDHEKKQNVFNEQVKLKIRKISAPSLVKY